MQHIIRTAADLELAHSILDANLYATFDIETDGLKVRTGRIIGFGCANNAGAFYVIMKEWNGTELVDVLSDADVKPLIEKLQRKRLITFNGSFDTRFTWHYFGVNLIDSIYCDVMLMTHTVDENRMDYKLKNIAASIFGNSVVSEQADMLQSIADNGGTEKEYYKANSTLMAKYGIQDNLLTLRLYNYFLPKLREQNLFNLFFNDEVMPHYRLVTIPMELKGLPVNVELMKQTLAEISADIKQVESEIHTAVHPHLHGFMDWFIRTKYPFKFSGSFKTALAARIAPANWPRTATGGYSFAEADLTRAIKKGLISTDEQLYKYAKGIDLVPQELIRDIQLQLMREDGLEHPFNLSSRDHLKRLFFVEHGGPLNEEPLSRTEKTKAPQINDDFLEAMALKYDWCAKLQTYNKLSKIKGTYIERFLEKQEDGIFYPSVFQHRTTSGRLSGDMQQLPRAKDEDEVPDALSLKYINKIRSFFIAGDGHKLVDADYSSLEVVVFADDAQDEALLDIIRKNYDFYSQTAIQVKGLTEYSADKKAPNFLKKLQPNIRQQAKAYALGIRYGEGSYKLHKELNISQSEADAIIDGYFTAFPKLKLRMDELIESAVKAGAVVSKSGRVRHLPELAELHERYGDMTDSLGLWKKYNDTPDLYAKVKAKAKIYKNLRNNSLNFPIQNMATSIVTKASIAIAREFKQRGLSAYLALSVHDELCSRCPENEVAEVSEIMQRLMEQTTKLSVPLSAEPMVGDNYGQVK